MRLRPTLLRLQAAGLAACFALWPSLAFAQDDGIEFSKLLLTIAIVLGIGSCLYVFFLSRALRGGQIATTLSCYGFGMAFVILSLLCVTWLKPFAGMAAGTLHDVFFIVGFLTMVVGSRRIAVIFKE